MANIALKYFMEKGRGQLVSISSVRALQGEKYSPAYSASKAFVSNYLEGIRHWMAKEKRDIFVTYIQPGWVNTSMAKGEETFWMVSARKAAEDIYFAVSKKRHHAYITAKWRLYAWAIKLSPKCVYDKFF